MIENLQGAPLPGVDPRKRDPVGAASTATAPGDLDALAAAGEVVWRGVEPVGDRDGRVALYLTDHVRACGGRSARHGRNSASARAGDRRHLQKHGASFFAPLHEAAGGGYPGETVDALWDLVWKGLLTNDTFHALRAFTRAPARRGRASSEARARDRPVRSAAGAWRRRPPRDAGRCSRSACPLPPSDTQWSTAMAQQLLARYGVVTREVAAAEGIAGGFGAVYDVLKALEDAGRVRRGYFVGVGATQFALPPALELLRSLREMPDEPETLVIAATDPANPYGTTLKWPAFAKATAGQARRGEAGGRRTRADADGRRAGRARQRRARRLRPARRPAGDGVPAGRRAGALDDRHARWPGPWRALARDEHRGGLLLAEINGREPRATIRSRRS